MTSFFDIFLASFLALLALTLIGSLLFLISSFLFGNFWKNREMVRIKQREAFLQQAELLAEKEEIIQAIPLFRKSFLLEDSIRNERAVDLIYNHHLRILSRLLAISDLKGIRMENLPIVEGLFLSRTELLRAQIEVETTSSNLRKRRSEKGKDSFEWAEREFVRKRAEIKDKLTVNRKTLESQLDEIFKSLHHRAYPIEFTYH